jgi:hypothetical protein
LGGGVSSQDPVPSDGDLQHRDRETGGMKSTVALLGVLGVCVLMSVAAAAQVIELPAGPNREVVSRECQACHDLTMVVASSGLTRDGWNGIIDEMTSYGLNVTPEQRTKILEYLSVYLGSASASGNASR